MSETPLYTITWYTDAQGKKVSYQRVNEQYQVVNGKIQLNDIPDQYYKVNVGSGYTETNINSTITSATAYKVNYDTGEVYFDSSKEGTTITIASYYGKGRIKLYAHNVKLEDVSNLYVADNVEDFASEISGRVGNIISGAGASNAEIVDARLSTTKGKTFSVLKSRLEESEQDVLSLKADVPQYVRPTGTANDTSYLQSAINTYPVVVVKAGTYYIDAVTRLKLVSNRIVSFEEGAILQAITTSSDQYRVLEIQGVSNVTLINPTIIGERDTHTGSTGESGHGIVLYSSKNIKIYNPVCKNCWGDGISIGYGNEDILIDNTLCDNNRRQGISLLGGKNITISNPRLINTSGTSPQFGLDIEPSFDTDILENIKIINPITKNNIGGGININLMALANTNKTIDILIDNHNDDGSTDGLYFYKTPSGIDGSIICNKGVYKNNTNRGIAIQNCSAENNLTTKVITPTIINANTGGISAPKYGSGISFFREAAETQTYFMGNVEIINPTIKDTRTPVKMVRGISMVEEKATGYKNVKIIDPLEVSGLLQSNRMDLILGDIKVSDKHQVFTHDFSGIPLSLLDRVYTKLINPTESSAQRTITLNQTYVTDYPITIQNTSTYGVKILPKITAKILPLSAVAGKYIATTQIGASITLRHISADIWYIENMIGTWTVEA
jgi:hypothetical protein